MEKPISTRPKRYSTLIGTLLGGILKLMLLSLLAWVLLLLFLSAIAIQEGREAANARSHFLLTRQIEFISSKDLSVTRDFLAQPAQFRADMESRVAQGLNTVSSFLQKIHQRTQGIDGSQSAQSIALNTQRVMVAITIVMETLEVVIGRLGIFMLSLLLWGSVLFVMIVDGLAQRDIRKFQAARESAFLFHRLKLLTSHVFYGYFLIFMSMPWVIEPSLLLLPMIMTVSVLSMFTIKYYKKYL